MKYSIYLTLVLLAFCTVFACKKKKVAPQNLTKTEMVARTWVCESAEITAPNRTVIYTKGSGANLFEFKDSFITFFNDGKYQAIDFNSIPQTGNWRFKNEETIAELDEWDYDFEILNLSAKNLNFNTKVEYNGKIYDIFVKMIPK
jgi:hypothetical protein